MTANQLAYQAHLEQQRANKAKEEETRRHNEVTEYSQTLGAITNSPLSTIGYLTGIGGKLDSQVRYATDPTYRAERDAIVKSGGRKTSLATAIARSIFL